jgi:hippurate hydrolase
MMGGEDFGGFLPVRRGAFIAVGRAESEKDSPHNFTLHSSRYDFNDQIIPIAAEYFAELAETRLPNRLATSGLPPVRTDAGLIAPFFS